MGVRSRLLAVGSVALLLATAMAACAEGDDGSEGATTTTGGGDGGVEAIDYSDRGPYPVGFMRESLGDRDVLVFYPADESAVGTAEPYTGYATEEAFPVQMRAVVPDAFRGEVVLDDVYLDIPAAEETFPVVLDSHGEPDAALYQSIRNSHLASWGFVVAAPEHRERGFEAFFLPDGVPDNPGYDVADLQNSVTVLEDLNSQADSNLNGRVDRDRLGLVGYSMGANTAIQPEVAALGIKTIVMDAPMLVYMPGTDTPPPADETFLAATTEDQVAQINKILTDQDPPDMPVLVIAGDDDGVVYLEWVEAEYEWLNTPKQLVALTDLGHNAFRDICEGIRAQGGLSPFADELPLTPEQVAQAEDGCLEGNLDPQTSLEVINHLTTAQMLRGLDIEDTSASLSEDYLDATFPDAISTVDIQP